MTKCPDQGQQCQNQQEQFQDQEKQEKLAAAIMIIT